MTNPETDRRRFFRTFAAQIIDAAATVGRTAGELQRTSQEAAREILEAVEPEPPPSGYRTPFRFGEGDVLFVVDQRRLPEALVEIPVKSGWDASRAIRHLAVWGAPAIGQVAALGLAIKADLAKRMRPYARRASLIGVANALRGARPTAVSLRRAVDRVLAHYDRLGGIEADGEALAAAMREEADRIVHEATTDHGRLAEFGLAALPDVGERPVRILTHGASGPLASGQYGTALGVIQAAHHGGRSLHVLVSETRPSLVGSRLTAWELAQAGVRCEIVADGAAGHLIARGEVDLVLASVDCVAANGDTASEVGTYLLAAVAARHALPLVFAAPLSSLDLEAADGAALAIEERPQDEVVSLAGQRIAAPGTGARNPAVDVTPADLITAFVTDEGVLRPPYGPALAAAAERRTARWTTAWSPPAVAASVSGTA